MDKKIILHFKLVSYLCDLGEKRFDKELINK